MQQPEHVAVFWDFENLPPQSGVPGYETVQAIRSLAHDFGVIISFKAYLEVSSTLRLWSELQASGVALIDCPHDKRTQAAGKMLLVDMIAFAIDHPAPATIFLISRDQDLAYAISTLRHRKYKVVVLCPLDSYSSLVTQADTHLDWDAKVLHESEDDGSAPSLAPQRVRHLSTSLNRITFDSERKGKGRHNNGANEDDRDPDRSSHRNHDTYSHSDSHERPEHTLPDTTSSWRTLSRTTSRPYSPGGSFRSAQSVSQTLSPPPKEKSIEPTFVTDGDIIFESSSQPDLREGFPFSENETTNESQIAQSSTSAPVDTVVKSPPPVSASLPVPSVGVDRSWKPSTPAFAPAALAAPVTPVVATAPTTTTVAGTVATISSAPAPMTQIKPVVPTLPPSTSARPLSSPPTARPPPQTAVARPAPSHFLPLITALQKRAHAQKQTQVMRTDLGSDLAKVRGLYAQAKVSKFASYILLAEEAGIVTLGGYGSNGWISLRPEWASPSRFPA